MSDISIYWDEIGEITLRKNQRAHKLSIKVSATKGVIVTVPRYMSFKTAEMLIEGKRDWMMKSIKKVSSSGKKLTRFDYQSEFATRWHVLNISQERRDDVSIRIGNGLIKIIIPMHSNVYEPSIQQIIRDAIERALSFEANEFLPKRTKEIAVQHNLTFRKVNVRNTSTLWGSCSGTNNISLNIHLMRLPEHLIDYIILHELMHTLHKNHGTDYWKTFSSYLGSDAKKMAAQLKAFHPKVF